MGGTSALKEKRNNESQRSLNGKMDLKSMAQVKGGSCEHRNSGGKVSKIALMKIEVKTTSETEIVKRS